MGWVWWSFARGGGYSGRAAARLPPPLPVLLLGDPWGPTSVVRVSRLRTKIVVCSPPLNCATYMSM